MAAPFSRSLSRIDAALARIEAALPMLNAGPVADAALMQRHARLRAEVCAVVAELDSIIMTSDDAATDRGNA